jgi:hypothetical protein
MNVILLIPSDIKSMPIRVDLIKGNYRSFKRIHQVATVVTPILLYSKLATWSETCPSQVLYFATSQMIQSSCSRDRSHPCPFDLIPCFFHSCSSPNIPNNFSRKLQNLPMPLASWLMREGFTRWRLPSTTPVVASR